MRSLTLIGVLSLMQCGLAHPITWDYGLDSHTQGWQARISNYVLGVPYPLPMTVHDGVLRIPMPDFHGGVPGITLISPRLAMPSELFDRVRLRVRLVTHTPRLGAATLSWTNDGNRLTPGTDPNRPSPSDAPDDYRDPYFLRASPPPLFTGEWQELSLAGFAEDGQLAWQGQLLDIRIALEFGPGIASDMEALEIDWVQLTGVEEQLSGLLPAPDLDGELHRGTLLSPEHFIALDRRGLKRIALGDLDADGDLDGVIHQAEPVGFAGAIHSIVSLVNDGTGVLAWGPRLLDCGDLGGECPTSLSVWPALVDLDGDGDADLIPGHGAVFADTWRNDGAGTFTQSRLWDARWVRCAADVDADGDIDLGCLDWSDRGQPDRFVWALNDGRGRFPDDEFLRLPDTGRLVLLAGRLTGRAGLQLLLTPPMASRSPVVYDLAAGYQLLDAYPGASPGPPRVLRLEAPIRSLAVAGDINHDGHLDMVVSSTATDEGYSDLVTWLNQGDGQMEAVDWLPTGLKLRKQSMPEMRLPYAWDLSGDGVPDWLFVDHNGFRGRNLLVLLGQPGKLPVLEGQYSLPGGGELEGVAAGDIDSDGDLDVVLSTTRQGGGLIVLYNQLSEHRTCVAGSADVPAVASALGDAYPNPFNGETVIPLFLSAHAHVTVAIYNSSGQQVRVLTDGALPAGPHVAVWDGAGESGQRLAAGVYLCQAQVGDCRFVSKLVHVP